MPSEEQSKEINEGLRSSFASSIKLAKVMHTEEGVTELQRSLNEYADGIGTYINLHVPLDQDVILAYAELRKIATEFNEDNSVGNNGKDILNIPLPYSVHPNTQTVTTFPFPEPSSLTNKNINQSKDITQNHTVNTKSEKMIASLTNTQTEFSPTIKPSITPTSPKVFKNRNQPITK